MKKVYLSLFVLLGIHLFLLFNLKFTAWPEMFSYPYLRNHGYLLYKDMIYPYPPVLTMALSIIYKLFGYKLIVLKVFTWLIILANDVLVFLIAKKLTKKDIFALLSLTLYVSIQPFLEGNQLWFDLAIVPFVLLSTYSLLQKKYFWSGLALGVAVLTKQTTGLFLVVSGLWLVISEKNFKKLLAFLAGPTILSLILLVRLFAEGAVSGFFNWVLIYPFTQWRQFPGYVQMALTHDQLVILALLVMPVILLFLKLKQNLFKDNNLMILVSSLLVSSILIYPRFSFFHFQAGIALAAVLFGVFVYRLKVNLGIYYLYLIMLFLYVSLPVIRSEWGKETRFWSKDEVKLSAVIRDKTKPGDLVYLQDIYSVYYVLSERLPPKPWTDNYGWYLEIPGVQEQIIKGWTKNLPETIIIQEPLPGNWHDLGTYKPKKIMAWIDNHYSKKEEIQAEVWLWERKLVLSE